MFVQHSLCKYWFLVFFLKVRLDSRKASCFILTAALWLKWDTSGGKSQSSLLESNWACSEITSECKCTAQNKKDHKYGISRASAGEKCPVKANSPRGLKSNEDHKVFLGIQRRLQAFYKLMRHWKVLKWARSVRKHLVLNCQIQKT